VACRECKYGLKDADLGERLCKGAMLSLLHGLAPSLVFFEVSKSYNEPILRCASCGNKTTIVTSRDLVILVEPPVD
jgi:hypothetical protein